LVSSEARSDAVRIDSTACFTVLSGMPSCSARSALPRIATSRLLKSCATPPASTPRLSMRWVCCRLRSSRRIMVMSTLEPMTPVTWLWASRIGLTVISQIFSSNSAS
jgi:hypothetical protein